jgi:hypothetical protein
MSIQTKCLVLLAALTVTAANSHADNPKTYTISVSSMAKVGHTEIGPGQYKLRADPGDPKVQFTDVRTGSQIELEAKVEITEERYDHTSIHFDRSNEVNRIIEIRLGGTKTRVDFR